MADIAVTASAVVKDAGAQYEFGISGGTIVAGDIVYRDTGDAGKFKLADANGASDLIKTPIGMALNTASNNQPLAVLLSGKVTMNAVLTANTAYFLSDTPGKIAPVADVGAGETMSLVGIAISTTVMRVGFVTALA